MVSLSSLAGFLLLTCVTLTSAKCGFCKAEDACGKNKTCCYSGGTGLCCAFDNGVCCGFGMYCCPNGYVCDSWMFSWRRSCTKISPRSALFPSDTVDIEEDMKQANNGTVGKTCPDEKSECPDDATCCTGTDGNYACCPLPRATCCRDHLHCCPEGSYCSADGNCQKRGKSSTVRPLFTCPINKRRIVSSTHGHSKDEPRPGGPIRAHEGASPVLSNNGIITDRASGMHCCEFCGYMSANRGNVTYHIRSKHTGERPYGCPYCDYRSSRKTTLRLHMNRHRPFGTEPQGTALGVGPMELVLSAGLDLLSGQSR